MIQQLRTRMRRYLANYTIPSDENQMRFVAVHKFLRPDPSGRKSKAHDLSLQTLLGLGNKQNGRKQGERGGDKILPLRGWICAFFRERPSREKICARQWKLTQWRCFAKLHNEKAPLIVMGAPRIFEWNHSPYLIKRFHWAIMVIKRTLLLDCLFVESPPRTKCFWIYSSNGCWRVN